LACELPFEKYALQYTGDFVGRAHLSFLLAQSRHMQSQGISKGPMFVYSCLHVSLRRRITDYATGPSTDSGPFCPGACRPPLRNSMGKNHPRPAMAGGRSSPSMAPKQVEAQSAQAANALANDGWLNRAFPGDSRHACRPQQGLHNPPSTPPTHPHQAQAVHWAFPGSRRMLRAPPWTSGTQDAA
jgi:hypothetical protein